MARTSLVLSFLLALVVLHGAHAHLGPHPHAVKYVVINNTPKTPGGIRFNKELGVEHTKHTMAAASDFIWKIFEQDKQSERKDVPVVTLTIERMEEESSHAIDMTVIHIGDAYIARYKDIKFEFDGVVYHEMTHIWQWTGNGKAPEGLLEGMADFVRLKAGYALPNWVKPGEGDRWDQGFSVTARFLDYLNGLKKGFVADLNKKLKDGYSEKYFVELLGKTVDQLWKEYKAMYAVKYVVINNTPKTPGGIRFNKELGVKHTKHTMAAASDFIWKIFEQDKQSERKDVPVVTLTIERMEEESSHAIDMTVIHIGDAYIARYKDIKFEFDGVVYHEMTHIWQWTGNGKAPEGLLEGMADFVRLKAGYALPNWVKPGEGDSWDQGFSVTARFLDYLNGLKKGFVADLNKKLKDGYSEKYFVELLGKTVDQLWKEYKAKYGY